MIDQGPRISFHLHAWLLPFFPPLPAVKASPRMVTCSYQVQRSLAHHSLAWAEGTRSSSPPPPSAVASGMLAGLPLGTGHFSSLFQAAASPGYGHLIHVKSRFPLKLWGNSCRLVACPNEATLTSEPCPLLTDPGRQLLTPSASPEVTEGELTHPCLGLWLLAVCLGEEEEEHSVSHCDSTTGP